MQRSNSEASPQSDPGTIAFCPGCFYDLRGTQGQTCPECGQTLDLQALRRSMIPWPRRGEVGRLQAFVRTAWQATLRPRQLCYAAVQPVSYRDARWFQLITVLWAVLGVAAVYALTLTAMVLTGNAWLEWPVIVIPAVVLLFLIPFLLAVTGVHTYWLHPRHLPTEQQNRAVALGYYAAAPLAFLPMAALLAGSASVVATEVSHVGIEDLLMILVFLCWAPLLAIPVAVLRVMVVMARHAAQRQTLGLTVMGIAVPFLWLALSWLILALIPALIGYVGLMLYILLT